MDRQQNDLKHNIKIDRIRSYFIQAAKEIILREGVESVTVRKVADLAGYSYATIYHYFLDLNALLQEVKTEMIRDVVAHMSTHMKEETIGIDEIKRLNRLYANYYIERPHVFTFFYSYRLTEQLQTALSFEFVTNWHSTFNGFVADGTIEQKDIETVAKTLIYALQGALALYFSNNGLSEELLYQDLDGIADYLLTRRAKA